MDNGAKGRQVAFAAMPCVPGLILLLTGVALDMLGTTPDMRVRVYQLYGAGGGVLTAGVLMGLFILWRIAHPRPNPEEGHPPAE